MNYNQHNPIDLNVYDQNNIPLFKKNLEGPIQGEKVMHADRDELNDKMSNIRMSNIGNQSNNFFQPYTPDLINIESDISHNQLGKKTEFRDTINDRMFQSHPSQLIDNVTGQVHPNHFHRFQQHIPAEYKDDRSLNSNFCQTNKFNNRDHNNNRLADLTPLGNNANLHTNHIQRTPNHLVGDSRIGISSNSYLDDNGNMIHNNNIHTKPRELQYRTQALMDENIMTIGRLPESNQSSRINFRDKNNERMQNLISLPKTSSLPVIPVNQQNQQKNNMQQRIYELNNNCHNVVNEMMPINTHLTDF